MQIYNEEAEESEAAEEDGLVEDHALTELEKTPLDPANFDMLVIVEDLEQNTPTAPRGSAGEAEGRSGLNSPSPPALESSSSQTALDAMIAEIECLARVSADVTHVSYVHNNIVCLLSAWNAEAEVGCQAGSSEEWSGHCHSAEAY